MVGNLIGLQTVDIAPRTGGRLLSVNVQLGDRVRRGQVLAKVEDREIVEQVRAGRGLAGSRRRRRFASAKPTSTSRSSTSSARRTCIERQLLAKQALDDAESRYLAAVAQLDLSKAQLTQTDARLEELRINLQNTSVTSPVDGFVGKRNVDPGAMVNTNTAIASVVDISRLRLVVNVVEKDLRMVNAGDSAEVEVDAYPGEKFNGQIARVAPVLDPATRTATMEVEIPNGDNKLKPGMYARINLTVEERKGTLVAPKNAVIDFENKRGVWMPNDENRATVRAGASSASKAPTASRSLGGLKEGDKFVTTGAAAVRNNDQLLIAGQGGPRRSGWRRAARARPRRRRRAQVPGPGAAARAAQAASRPEATAVDVRLLIAC